MKIFIQDIKGIKVEINVNSNDTIYEVKKKYGDHYVMLKYNGEILNNNKTIEYYGIEEEDIIIANQRVLGGEVGSVAKGLADPTKKGPVKWPTSKEGPDYLIVKNGINLFGNCKNKKCIAFNKEVCSPFGFGTFDLIEDLDAVNEKCPHCPACEFPLVKLETCGFKKCRYSYIGTKIENKSNLVPVNYNGSISEDHKIDYFKAGKNGENKSLWIELKITANPL